MIWNSHGSFVSLTKASSQVACDTYMYRYVDIYGFLRWSQAAALFELNIYTMGNRSYAKEMARTLDHSGALFSGRIIAKGDDAQAATMSGFERDEFGPPHHKDMDGVLGMESTALIVDDSAGVWPHHAANLIVVERYLFRLSSRGPFRSTNPVSTLFEMETKAAW